MILNLLVLVYGLGTVVLAAWAWRTRDWARGAASGAGLLLIWAPATAPVLHSLGVQVTATSTGRANNQLLLWLRR